MTAKTLIPGPPEPSIPPPPPFDPSEPIDAPPDYRAITIVPEAPFLTPAQVPPIAASQVKVERDSELNVTTYDAIVESNPDELWRYFLTYSDKPGLEARIEGWRYEDRWRTESYFENGEHRSRQVHERERVTDFMVSVNLSAYIQPGWKRLVAIDQKGNFRPIREVLEEFTLNKERLKEIGMTKQVQWDFAQVISTLLIRSLIPAV